MRLEELWSVLRGLSSLARTGWMLRGVPHELAEPVASHSFWAAVLAHELALELRRRGARVDPERAALIALYHDMAEARIGDIAKVSGISEAEKERAERAAVESLPVSEESRSLIVEFMDRSSPEAKLAKLGETLATLLRALDYERIGFDVSDIRGNMCRSLRRMLGELEKELGVEFGDLLPDPCPE